MSCRIATPSSSFSVTNALSYITGCYDSSVGLCHENASNPTKYWLWTDNIVASKALKLNGITNPRITIDNTVQSYMTTFGIATMSHAIVAICDQSNSAFSNLATLDTQDQVGPPAIWHTGTPGPGTLADTDYSDIAFLHAVNLFNTGNTSAAQTAYNNAVAQFDGTGFADKPWQLSANRQYQTYKAALWIIAHKITHFTPTPKIGFLDSLFARLQDAATGGMRTGYLLDYTTGGSGINVETTGIVVIAASLPL